MDFLRARAIPALIAASALTGASAACDTLNGTYQYESVAPAGGRPRYLSDFTLGPERRQIIRSEGPAVRGPGLGSDQLRSRPKVRHLASTGTLAALERGATIEFRDATGKALVTMDIGEGWVCTGDALERDSERTHGLGDNLRTERVQERLANARGDLVYTETTTDGGKRSRIEVRYRGVK